MCSLAVSDYRRMRCWSYRHTCYMCHAHLQQGERLLDLAGGRRQGRHGAQLPLRQQPVPQLRCIRRADARRCQGLRNHLLSRRIRIARSYSIQPSSSRV
jgi:hypothetical protein